MRIGGSTAMGLAVVAALGVGLASDARSANAVFDFTGTTSVAMDGVAAGTPFSGSFVYDRNALAPLGDVAFYGGTRTIYESAYSALTMTIGGHTVQETVPGVITVYNNVTPPNGVPVGDSMYTFTPGNGNPNPSTGSFTGLTPNFIYLGFVDTKGSAFSGSSLPSTLDLNSFTSAFIGVNFHPYGSGNTTTISNLKTLTSPIPEPSTNALAIAGLCVLAFVARRRSVAALAKAGR